MKYINDIKELTRRAELCRDTFTTVAQQYPEAMKDWKWAGFDKAKTRAAICNRTGRFIRLSSYFVGKASTTDAMLADMVKRQIAHILAGAEGGKAGHNERWVDAALKLGCSTERKITEAFTKGHWRISCPNNCYTPYHRHKRINIQNSKCKKCEAHPLCTFANQIKFAKPAKRPHEELGSDPDDDDGLGSDAELTMKELAAKYKKQKFA